MTFKRNSLLGLIGGGCLLAMSSAALADGTVVHVIMGDTGAAAMDRTNEVAPMGMAMGGDNMMATMSMVADITEIAAGEITFEVTNASEDFIHEMIVIPIANETDTLPYSADNMAIDEDAAGALGEVEETDPGASGSLTLRLEPGEYMLVCNIPGHYAMGMWTTITVTGS